METENTHIVFRRQAWVIVWLERESSELKGKGKERDELWRRDALSLVIITLPQRNARQLLALVAVNFIS